jgi:hypothetical protein
MSPPHWNVASKALSILSMGIIDRARGYIAKCPPAISGQGGHNQTFDIACALVHGFALPETDALMLLREYNATLAEKWTEKELLHKIESAAKSGKHNKPRGHLVGSGLTFGKYSKQPDGNGKFHNAPVPKNAKKRYDITGGQLPGPMGDGARLLIQTLFKEGEGIRVAPAHINDKGDEVPDGKGPCLPREEWLRKLDAVKGNPNGIFSSSKKTGIYIGLNPMRIGGSTDSDVTDFRLALVEFDKELSLEEQFKLYQESKLPCAAVLYSGGKSVHAWVKVGAANHREYDERVKLLYDHFVANGFPLDPQNKNPSRLSRLPNCVRFDRRQELLLLNPDWGCETFADWIEIAQGGAANLRQLLIERRFDPTRKPPETRSVYRMAGVTISTPGNLTVISAQAKTGKSALVGAFIASTIVSEGTTADTLSVTSSNPSEFAVIHFDTEQSLDDYWRHVDRARRRAGGVSVPSWLLSYCLTGMTPRQLRNALNLSLEDAQKQFGGVHSVLIDGAADLVLDVNNPSESNPLVTELHALAIQYNCPIIGVIHFNPASDRGPQKTRGHFGSQLERKSETNLVLTKNDETIEIHSEKQRGAPIFKGMGPSFRWSQEAGMHVSCKTEMDAKLADQIEDLRCLRDDIFGDKATMRWGDMQAIIAARTSPKTAERRIKALKHHRLIKELGQGNWEKGD